MTHWLDVFRYELRFQFSRKAYLFFTFGLPLLLIVGFYGYQAIKGGDDDGESPQVKVGNDASRAIGYVDRSGLFPAPTSYPAVNCAFDESETAALAGGNALVSTRQAAIKRVSSPYCLHWTLTAYDSVQAGQDALDADRLDALYVIEPDYAETGNLSVYVSGFGIEQQDTQGVMQDYLIRSVLYHVGAADYESLYLRLRDPAFVIDHRISATGATQTENEDRKFVLVYGFGMLMMLGLFWGGGYLMQSVVEEKETRMIEIMLSSLQPTALLAGKILAMALLSLLQLTLMVGTFVFLAGQAGSLFADLGDMEVEPLNLLRMFVYFVLGFLLFGSLMAAIGALSISMRESQNFVVFITLPAVIPFFFISIIAEEPNGTLAVVLSLIPFTSSLSMAMRLSVTDVPIGELLLSLGLLLLGVMGAIWLAGRLFRVHTLLAGNLPKFSDLPRLILRG